MTSAYCKYPSLILFNQLHYLLNRDFAFYNTLDLNYYRLLEDGYQKKYLTKNNVGKVMKIILIFL